MTVGELKQLLDEMENDDAEVKIGLIQYRTSMEYSVGAAGFVDVNGVTRFFLTTGADDSYLPKAVEEELGIN